MKIIECYEVLGNSDTTEGRGPMIVVARFFSKDEAELYVKSKVYSRWCVMGYQSTNDVKNNICHTKLIIFDKASEFADVEKEETKARALAKLTVAERIALGVE